MLFHACLNSLWRIHESLVWKKMIYFLNNHLDEKKFWNYFGHREAYSQDYRISITSFKFDCINCTNFFLFHFSEGFFSFVLGKNFGLEDMSPSLDCKGYLNGLIFNFKVIRISQELDSQHYRISLKQALNSTISTAPFFFG